MNKLYLFILIGLFCSGCGKEFLDIKREAHQVVPKTIKDYHAIMANDLLLVSSNDLAFVAADEYTLGSEADLIVGSQYNPIYKHIFKWENEGYESDEQILDWNFAYERIAYANLAMDVERVKPTTKYEHMKQLEVRLAARFHRARNYYQLAQLFCKAYDPQTADQEMGLPLRLDYDLDVSYERSSLKQLYVQILKDLHEAEEIGQEHSVDNGKNPYFPGLLSVEALASRIYLQMGDYKKAQEYADKVLQKMNSLIDYNNLTGNITGEYTSYFRLNGAENPELIFYTVCKTGAIMTPSRFRTNEKFFQDFDDNDLRKEKGFYQRAAGNTVFIGSFAGRGASSYFTGFSVGEMLLNRAECYARSGEDVKALADINRLRAKRYRNYQVLNMTDVDDMTKLVLMERRKELFMRGMRWDDARRLNREGKYPVSFQRTLEGKTYTLEPNSKNWLFPLPPTELERGKLEDNIR
ncbi:RagB/SusD family nutrient uptake outer membrane protein [Sphingobacterium sp. UT-1RO-CII-1]|uniref:RagB/SusD family nutrient uptake outer membrane protein n=1 Tax=Sphingobacterium sp. UT-1RO-CII-1 TaxID=2995225 RepID=UPI00227BDE1C|nr:RagB/SusD family nutrient uptake outer membrane protein [Sphingobacterium sp. UT-1RO-CII-1]MCY4780784.1 RagB/SusD family nutrient uptake outer membrane protein [Sphingobacterium sp. UT-1RO-CII-1]